MKFYDVSAQTRDLSALMERLSWGKQYEIMLGVGPEAALILLEMADDISKGDASITIEAARREILQRGLSAVKASPGPPGILGTT